MHSKLCSEDRQKNHEFFRRSGIIAVAMDLMARAIDVPAIKAVINFKLPRNMNTRPAAVPVRFFPTPHQT